MSHSEICPVIPPEVSSEIPSMITQKFLQEIFLRFFQLLLLVFFLTILPRNPSRFLSEIPPRILSDIFKATSQMILLNSQLKILNEFQYFSLWFLQKLWRNQKLCRFLMGWLQVFVLRFFKTSLQRFLQELLKNFVSDPSENKKKIFKGFQYDFFQKLHKKSNESSFRNYVRHFSKTFNYCPDLFYQYHNFVKL